jgi:hypothetical protein
MTKKTATRKKAYRRPSKMHVAHRAFLAAADSAIASGEKIAVEVSGGFSRYAVGVAVENQLVLLKPKGKKMVGDVKVRLPDKTIHTRFQAKGAQGAWVTLKLTLKDGRTSEKEEKITGGWLDKEILFPLSGFKTKDKKDDNGGNDS